LTSSEIRNIINFRKFRFSEYMKGEQNYD